MLPSPSRLRPIDEPLQQFGRAELRLVPRENRVAVMLNANAKKVNARVRKTLERVVPSEDLFFSESFEDGQRQARTIIQRRYNAVMLGGGDGTIGTTMNMLLEAAESLSRGNLRHSLPDIGIMKLGTGNGLANVAGAGKPMDDLMRVLSGERPPAHPLRLIEDKKTGWVFPFASMGYDAQVLNDFVEVCNEPTTPFGKKVAKSLAGYFYALSSRTIPTELKGRRAQVRVVSTGRTSILDPETDEEIPLETGATLFEGMARAVLVGTSPFYGFSMKVLPFARRRSDRFHVRISTATIPFILSHLPSVWTGKARTPHLVDFLSEGIHIESSLDLPTQMSGDARGHMRELDLRLSDRALRLIDGTGEKSE